MKKAVQILVLFLLVVTCEEQNKEIVLDPEVIPVVGIEGFISSVDISNYPEIASTNPVFYNLNGAQEDFLDILKENGINTIRLRLWVNPQNEHSGFNEVKDFSETLKSKGFKTWLTVHYSDTWADPGHQTLPAMWKGISISALHDSVFSYTQKVVKEMQPDYIQIGNEINSGFLHPYGHFENNLKQFLDLMGSAIIAVRSTTKETKIILHYAGITGSDWFFDKTKVLDYDIIGLSYYPVWHGKSLNNLKEKMIFLSETFSKNILIAETAYPFTLEWNDWTSNIIGIEEQLILPEYPATNDGQQKFMRQIKSLSSDIDKGIGFSYWGAELISWKGDRSLDASPWENQALFDFENKALPVLKEFIVD